MGAMFRSEEMVLAQIFIQPEAAYHTISELGEIGVVQFRDLNKDLSPFQRKFVAEVKRCDEMERKLRYMEEEVKKEKVLILDAVEIPKAPNPREIIDLEAHIEKTDSDIKELSTNAVSLKTNFLELTELRYVLEKTHSLFSQSQDVDSPHTEEGGQLGFMAGVINRERVNAFERMLWIVSRGNVFLRQADIEEKLEDPKTGNEIQKTVFVAFFQGERLKNRVKKVCEGFHASLYPCPTHDEERGQTLKQVRTRLEDLKVVLNQTQDHRQRVLVSVSKELQNWTIMVKKMKAIYYTLNLFNVDVTKKCLIGEGWIPVQDVEAVRNALTLASRFCGSSIPSFMNIINTHENPPTFNRTNKFTNAFQILIDAYGVASYREANPALYTIITFPFLFAIMFGDCGHGVIMFLFGLYMVLAEKKFLAKKIDNEIWNIFFGGRYIILLMGIFSIYTGFVYNDVFSKSMNIFGSKWNASNYAELGDGKSVEDYYQLNPTWDYTQEPYFIGLDPVWQMATNKIIFLNSFKMKLSIIFGVIHMIFGVCVSMVNFVHFKKYSSIFLEFLPQVIFLCVLFLWMVVMMFMKWVLYDPAPGTEQPFTPGCAPSVLIFFINMMLFKSQEPLDGCDEYMFEVQPILQKLLVGVALICIPIMLLGKPLYIQYTRKDHKAVNGGVNQEEVANSHGDDDHEEEEISEVYIHQAIHTIEYVLSTVSHTASYLRLWALSLAHAQLSEVLWSMVLQKGLALINHYVMSIYLYLVFAAWAVFTVAILVMMEGLSAFLHTLRLHWVEFMSKFYQGLGYPFQPFSFKNLLDEEEKPSE